MTERQSGHGDFIIGKSDDVMWLVVATGDRTIPTMNDLIGKHWSHYHRIRDAWAAATADAIIEARVGATRWDRVSFDFTPTYPAGWAKTLPDTSAIVPATKAIVDQIVAAEIIPDDNSWHSAGETHWPPTIDTAKRRFTAERRFTGGISYPVVYVTIWNLGPSHHTDCDCRRIYQRQKLGAHQPATQRRKRTP